MDPIRDPEGIEVEYLEGTGALGDRRVIEIGCGNGRLTWRYANFATAVVGIDPDFEKLVETAGPRTEMVETPLLFVQAEAERLPFADEVFESVLLSWSL